MAFIPAFPSPNLIGRGTPSPLLGQSGVEARAAGASPRGYPPVPPHRFIKFSDYHLIILINRVDADLITCCIQRNLIFEQHTRNDRHPPTQLTSRQPTDPSYHQTLQPICATAVQRYSSTYLVHTPSNRGVWSVLDFFS